MPPPDILLPILENEQKQTLGQSIRLEIRYPVRQFELEQASGPLVHLDVLREALSDSFLYSFLQ